MLQERIALLVEKADEVTAKHWEASGYTFAPPPKHRADFISDKWCRVVTMEERNGKMEDSSVYCFVCLQDGHTKALGNLKAGDIHKAAGYKAPAKHARGNVFNDSFANCLTSHGIVYLRH
ncbi:hypothetical protein [Nitrospira sp. BLG_2]|uniref:hypothetical protein n=1 Tax=Nitrospira sp. BLG_2 TaxID=3397507 RepID=UPI003B995C39